MKYSIIMPYYKRAEQLKATLESFEEHYGRRYDFEIVIVTDSKMTAAEHRELIDITNTSKFLITIIGDGNKKPCFNPSTAFNRGVESSCGDYIVLTSPECLHQSDILAGLDEEFEARPFSYVVCGCMAAPRAKKDRGKAFVWYQHSEHKNNQYHFCSCLHRDLYKEVGGFDERFTDGYGYDDDAFRDRVRMKGVFFKNRDDLIVFHQDHEKKKPPGWRELLQRNRDLYIREYYGDEA